DVDDALEVFRDACERLNAMGVRQWPEYPSRQLLEESVNRRELHVCRINDVPAAIFRLLWSDEETWGPDDGLAGYVHMLAVHRRFSGTGCGKRVLFLAEQPILHAGRTKFRLDCVSSSAKLRSFYLDAGFRYVEDR